MLRLFTKDEGASIDIDKDRIDQEDFGLCPKLFYTVRDQRIDTLSRNAASIAADKRCGLDPLAIVEQAVLEFPLGNRTIFNSVKRLLPWERMSFRDSKLAIETQEVNSPPTSIMEYLSDKVCEALREGAALELTGGMDSRLMLACGLRRDVKPKLSFTIGAASSYDVHTASAIAKHFDFPHLTLPLVVDQDRIGSDAIEFIRASGYGVNATCYAWLPATIAVLNSERTAQITGLVGEIAGSSYYTPFDLLIEPLRLYQQWVNYRLVRPWIDWRWLWNRDMAAKLESDMIEEALRDLNSFKGTWRERTDLFYKHKKIGRWAMPVLDASNYHYTVVAPLLSPEYCAWALSMSVSQRIGRENERALLRQAHPQLADFKAPGEVVSPKAQSTVLGKMFRRIRGKKRESALGTVMSAIALARDRAMRDLVEAMAHESDAGFSTASIEHLLDHPDEHPEMLGMVITAAVAWHDLKIGKQAETDG